PPATRPHRRRPVACPAGRRRHRRGRGLARDHDLPAASGHRPHRQGGTGRRRLTPVDVAMDVIAHMDALRIGRAILAGFDWGARSADVIAALWPDRFKALVSVSGYLIGSQAANAAPLPPTAELAWWYQFYLATERGRAGYDKYRREFSRLIWQLASPKWAFDDATFARTAVAFDNPDHVAIVIHNYRWRLGLAAGESQYDDVERRLADAPTIAVPAITLEGDANGAPHADASVVRLKFELLICMLSSCRFLRRRWSCLATIAPSLTGSPASWIPAPSRAP